jgi:chromosome segregation ATPase
MQELEKLAQQINSNNRKEDLVPEIQAANARIEKLEKDLGWYRAQEGKWVQTDTLIENLKSDLLSLETDLSSKCDMVESLEANLNDWVETGTSLKSEVGALREKLESLENLQNSAQRDPKPDVLQTTLESQFTVYEKS